MAVKARCLSYTGDRATVAIAPSWLGRLFGCRTVAVDLERLSDSVGRLIWYAPASGRKLEELDGHREILDALDFREVGSEPRRVNALLGGVVAP